MIRNPLRDRVDSHVILLVGLLIFEIGVFSILEPATYPTRANFTSMTLQASEIGLLALGVVLTMIVSGIDLSIVATANVAGIIAATTMTAMDGPSSSATALAIIVGVLIALAWGAAAGALNGTLVVGARVSPILVTLGTLTFFTGIGTAATEGKVVFGIDAFTSLGDGKVAGLAVPFLLLVALTVLLSLLLARTRFGFEAYLVGENARAAWFSGISVRSRQFAMYVASGMLSAVAGLVVLGRTNAAQVDFGQSFVLLAVLVAVLGGIDPYGGRGSPLGAVAGCGSVTGNVNRTQSGSRGAHRLELLQEFCLGNPAYRGARDQPALPNTRSTRRTNWHTARVGNAANRAVNNLAKSQQSNWNLLDTLTPTKKAKRRRWSTDGMPRIWAQDLRYYPLFCMIRTEPNTLGRNLEWPLG